MTNITNMLLNMYLIIPGDARPAPQIETSNVLPYRTREERNVGMPELTIPRDGSSNDEAPDGHYEF